MARTRRSCSSPCGEQPAPVRLRWSCCTKAGLCFQGSYDDLLQHAPAPNRIEAIYGGYQHASAVGEFIGFDRRPFRLSCLLPPEPHSLNTAPPPGSFSQLFTLVRRQNILIWRDKAQIWLHLALLLSFSHPGRHLRHQRVTASSEHEPDASRPTSWKSMAENPRLHAGIVSAAALVSGLSMFQVILARPHGSQQRRPRNRQGARRPGKGIARGTYRPGPTPPPRSSSSLA